MIRARSSLPTLLAALALLAPRARAQDPAAPPAGAALPVSREAMWPAPGAEDWQKPCLVGFQRTWEDALSVARETGKPLLVCVNMDGEIASEHYAGVRYRQPEKAALYEPYVCVIASVYRHTPRDHDEEGRRILCPRFGSVTCGEHIAIEPVLYELFMDGKRIAPRHIGVELEQGKSEIYDVYYAFDTDSVFEAIRAGTENRSPPRVIVRGDRPLEERVASRDREDRTAIETAYVQGGRQERRRLLEAALRYRELDQLDLLRLALFGLDLELARLARAALAESRSEQAIDLIVEVLRVPLEESERASLVAALQRLGETYPRARTLATVQQGLGTGSSALDVSGWSQAMAGAEYPAPDDWVALESRLEERSRSSVTRPADPAAQLELAEASLALAVDPETARILSADQKTASRYARLHFEDARRAGLEAEKSGARGWRLDAVLALSAFYLGDLGEAHARAEAAVRALPSGEESWNAMAVLTLFAQAREQAILAAQRDNAPWPPEWLADVDATYSILARHPLGADYQFAAHHDFLRKLGASGRAGQALEAGLARFPDSWLLHERLRAKSLEERGVEGLEATYQALLSAEAAAPNLEWFAGYASLVTAEYYRRAGNPAAAAGAYERAIAHYERSIERNPGSRASSDHYVALALGGRARLAFEAGDHARAVAELLLAFERRPEAAATLDGLNLSTVDTARMLLARLQRDGEVELASRLDAALGRLDPELLRLPAYEGEGPAGFDRPARRRRPREGG